MKKVLYVSGLVGLGHVMRDLAIAAELRRLNPDLEVSWFMGAFLERIVI
jgi:predicted glycosyltransferase